MDVGASRDGIFISYRRDDARGGSGRLYDWLRIAFGRDNVFRDVASVGVGRWREKIDAALARCRVGVAVIGPRWAGADNLVRLHDPEDMVRHELVRMLANEAVTMVPTLIEGAEPPSAVSLPEELRGLFDTWNAVTIHETGWEDDTRALIDAIARETGLVRQPDLDELLDAERSARERLAVLERKDDFRSRQVEALQRTVDDLRTRLADATPPQRTQLARAYAALAAGDTEQAELAFEQAYEDGRRSADAARRAQAEAARNIGNLAMLHDLRKATAFYRKAVQADEEDGEGWWLLGRALQASGSRAEAERCFERSLALARRQASASGTFAALVEIGELARLEGNRTLALARHRSAHRIAEACAETDPDDALWQVNLSISHQAVGELLLAQGDAGSALRHFHESLAIGRSLAARQPEAARWQRTMSIDHEKIGDALRAQGDHVTALRAYRASLDITESLARRDPTSLDLQRDLWVGRNKVGDALLANGDASAARDLYDQGLALARALGERDPLNTEWQGDLSISLSHLGHALHASGDLSGAELAYRESLAFTRLLVARDPLDSRWLHDLSVVRIKTGDVLQEQGDEDGALRTYQDNLETARSLAARDPANPAWQRDLAINQLKVGDLLRARGDRKGSLRALQDSLAIVESLAASFPDKAVWQTDLAVICSRLGMLDALGSEERRQHLQRGLAVLSGSKAGARANEDWIVWFSEALAALPPDPPKA